MNIGADELAAGLTLILIVFSPITLPVLSVAFTCTAIVPTCSNPLFKLMFQMPVEGFIATFRAFVPAAAEIAAT